MKTAEFYNDVWNKAEYRHGSTCQRLVPLLRKYIPENSVVNDYGSGTGRAEELLLEFCSRVHMVDFAPDALEDQARSLIGDRLTYTISPLESLPEDFPIADWGICINVLMTCELEKLDDIMKEMRRTCKNLIIENYDLSDIRLGIDMTSIKGDANFWRDQMSRYWPIVESINSPEATFRYITIGRSL